jgi:hypothetical protein
MPKKRVPVPRAHDPTVLNGPLRLTVQPGTTVLRVPPRVAAPPTESVLHAQHAPILIVRPAASVPRVRSMTVRPPANDPLMVTARLVANDLTGSAPLAPLAPIQTALVQTGLALTGPAPIARELTARVVTSGPLVSDLVAQLGLLMTAPVTPSALRAPQCRTSFTMRLPLFRSLLIQQRA